jgi:hypothetical protein
MVDFAIDIEMSLTMNEFLLLKELAEKQSLDISTVARQCMIQKCQERLNVVKANKRTKKRNVSDKTS